MTLPVPLLDRYLALGATVTVAEGRQVAANFGNVADEVERWRSSTVLVDLGHRGATRVSGHDALDFLEGQSTAAIKRLPPGAGVEALFLTGKGKLRGAVVALRQANGALLLTTGGSSAELATHLASFVIMEQVTVEDLPATTQLGVYGDDAAKVVEAVLGSAVAGLPEHGHVEASHQGQAVTVVASRYGQRRGFVLHLEVAAVTALDEALARQLPRVGYDALEVARVEAGLPRFGADMDHDTLPIEAGLVNLIDYNKGCFTGYEVMARIRTYGHVNRHLVGLWLGAPVVAGARLWRGDKQVGQVTSCVVSPDRGPIALAMVRREHADAGTTLVVGGDDHVGDDHVGDERTSAVVTVVPFGLRPGGSA